MRALSLCLLLGCAAASTEDAEVSTAAALTGPYLRPVDAAPFTLTANESFATYRARIEGLEKTNEPAAFERMFPGDHRIRDLCHDTFSTTLGPPKGFCFEDGEDDDLNVWVNQGLAGNGGGDRMAVSWHSGKQHPQGSDKLARISFVDLTTKTYRHVMLVEPTSNEAYQSVASHADGLFWYGQKLLLAQGGFIRVFDTTHLWKTNAGYVMPQVGWFRHPGVWTCTPFTGGANCFNGLALDGDTFVSVEYSVRRDGGRVVRWPIDPVTSLPKMDPDGLVRATEAFTSPIWGMQGGISRNGTFAITGVCPEYATITDRDMPSCLHVGRGGDRTRVVSKLPKNSQNLFYSAGDDRLWITSEQLRERVVMNVAGVF